MNEVDPSPDETRSSTRWRTHPLEWSLLIVVALVLATGLRSFVFQTYFIPSGSMEPTLQIGDRIVVDKLAVRFGTVNRGDVVVFHSPAREDCAGVHDPILVKRVIGLPGDTLYSIGNIIYVDGHALDERWPHSEPLGPPAVATPRHPVHVAPGRYFMVGDNHFNSCDSRYWGTVPRSAIIGKVFMRVWPFGRIGFL